MGAPKQKWSAEEEAALKAGVLKHGAGRWRTILKDPEFSNILYLRSNVDLKDKWRNLSVLSNGWGSRDKSKFAFRRVTTISEQEEIPIVLNSSTQTDKGDGAIKPTDFFSSKAPIPSATCSATRLGTLIMNAIASLNEPEGSNKTAIAAHIEDQYWVPQDFKPVLSAKLKSLTATGKLLKVKRKYRIQQSPFPCKRKNSHVVSSATSKIASTFERDAFTSPAKTQIDLELARMRSMTAAEAAAAAAQAVAEAEAAIMEAEAAAREAEMAEADAAVAQALAETAMETLEGNYTPKAVSSIS